MTLHSELSRLMDSYRRRPVDGELEGFAPIDEVQALLDVNDDWEAKFREAQEEVARLKRVANELAAHLVTNGSLDAALERVLAREWTQWPNSAHKEHLFDGSCAVCSGDVAAVLKVALDRSCGASAGEAASE